MQIMGIEAIYPIPASAILHTRFIHTCCATWKSPGRTRCGQLILNRYHSSRHLPAVRKNDFHTLPVTAGH
jgi:hypothetical protein